MAGDCLLGALEGIYGRTQYLGDWISYLNVSRAVSVLDWKRIFDPMWNPGYPALVAVARVIFPHTAEGEWYAITLLNWLIFLFALGSWQYLIRAAVEFYDPDFLEFAFRRAGARLVLSFFVRNLLPNPDGRRSLERMHGFIASPRAPMPFLDKRNERLVSPWPSVSPKMQRNSRSS